MALSPRMRPAPVHPHTRGEQEVKHNLQTTMLGSSPHTWGTDTLSIDFPAHIRFIPTHVGNRWKILIIKLISSVHPHTRGEQAKINRTINTFAGSSPHTWGTVRHHPGNIHNSQFIPTHVGNSSVITLGALISSVHPHTRGEQRGDLATAARCYGSSPHTWGTGFRPEDLQHQFRFIPTHVGNRIACTSLVCASKVHPHTRGEQNIPPFLFVVCAGSSPHTWGTGRISFDLFASSRFIPTHVGNRKKLYIRLIRMSVHPHTRGEQF